MQTMTYKRTVYFLARGDGWYWQSTESEEVYIGFFASRKEAENWAKRNSDARNSYQINGGA